jgi:Tfp pilus assembly protein PilF
MEERQIGALLEQAEAQRRLGNHRGAISLLQKALTIDPDHAVAHAALAFTLLGAKRLGGAAVELRIALSLDASDRYIHHAAAEVLAAQRKLTDAWAHCLIALEEPTPDACVLGARIRTLQGNHAHARELLTEALALDAQHTDALTRFALLELHAGNHVEARQLITRALESDPADHDAHLVAGYVELAFGDAAAAEQHARFVLGQNATRDDALELWAAVRARRSWLLGAWWRFHMWISLRDDRRRIALLIGMFVLARTAIILTDELGYPGVSHALRLAWLGLCAYTWFAPALFRYMLARSLGTVRLDPEF